MDIQKRIEKRLDHGSKWENASNNAPSDLQQLGSTLDQNSEHTVDFGGHKRPIGSKVHTEAIFEHVNIQKRIEKRLDHGSKWESASNSAPNDLQQLGNTLDQNSKHTDDFEGHEEPIASNLFLSFLVCSYFQKYAVLASLLPLMRRDPLDYSCDASFAFEGLPFEKNRSGVH